MPGPPKNKTLKKKTVLTHHSKDPRMALIEMASTADAIEALMNMHDYRFGDNSIRVSFSKSTI
jgi:hypothetical protein